MMELFHIIADENCAAVRRKIMELGLRAQVEFRNIDASADARARLEALLGRIEVPALFASDKLITNKDEIIRFLESAR